VSSPADSMLGAQLEAMLQRVGEYREQHMAGIRTRTAARVEQIVRDARKEARQRVHEAVGRERVRLAQGLRQAQARAELDARERAQHQTLALLQQMWQRIGAALEARWRAPPQRAAWIAAAVAQSAALLGGRPWRVECATGVCAEDRAQAEGSARAHGVSAIEWQLDPQLPAGLRVRTTGACLDATGAGLLALRVDVEALFLAEYAAVAGPTAQPSADASATGGETTRGAGAPR